MTAISNSGTIRFEPHSATPEEPCAICLENFESQELNKTETTTLSHAAERTHHVFHQNCLQEFFRKRLSEDNPTLCPLCMQPADASSVLPLSEFMIYREKQMMKNTAIAIASSWVHIMAGYTTFFIWTAPQQYWEDNYATIMTNQIVTAILFYNLARDVYLAGGPRAFFTELQQRIAGI